MDMIIEPMPTSIKIAALYTPAGGSQSYLGPALSAEGFVVKAVADVGQAEPVDVALVVARSMDDEALALLRDLRARRPDLFQVVVLDHDDIAGRLAAYAAGADDCLSKPFHFDELVAKLKALQRRRTGGAVSVLLSATETVFDHAALEIRFGGHISSLTKREAELLAVLARADGAIVRRDQVLREAWAAPGWMTSNLVDVYVGYVRRKLEDVAADVAINTVRGEGFQIVSRPVSGRGALPRRRVPLSSRN